MNNTFNFNRFKKLMGKELREYLPNFGQTLLTLLLIPLGIFIINMLFGSSSNSAVRLFFMNILFLGALFLAPEKLYGKSNLQRYGVGYAMLPASAFEKFLSSFIYCAIVTPIVFLLGSIAIDSLLSLLPFGGFNGFILDSICGNYGLFVSVSAEQDLEIMNQLNTPIFIAGIFGFLAVSGIFMFGNMIFKSHKTTKTILSCIGISFVFFVLTTIIISNNTGIIESFFSNMDVDNTQTTINIMKKIIAFSSIVNAIIAATTLFGTYYKIKTQKY